jgi:hypothetical protein
MTTGVTRAAVLVLFLVTAGCSNSQPTTASVKGVIKTKQGQACDKALIVFHPLEKSRVNDAKPVAIAESNGEFVVRTHTIDDGAAPGEYGVTVVWPGDSSGNQEFSLSGEGNFWYGKKRPDHSAKVSKPVVVTDPAGKTMEYASISILREEMKLKPPTVNRALKSGKPLSRGPYNGWSFKYLDSLPNP